LNSYTGSSPEVLTHFTDSSFEQVALLSNAWTWTSAQTYQGGIVLSGSRSLNAWGAAGPELQVAALTLTDANSSGTVGTNYINTIAQTTLIANSATSYTIAAELYVAGAPISSTNVTQTYPLSIYAAAGLAGFAGGLSAYQGDITKGSNFSAAGGQGLANNTTTASLLFGGASGIQYRAGVNGSFSGTLTISDSYANFIVGSSPITTGATGTNSWIVNEAINPVGTITGGGSTITNSATLYVGAAGSGATNNYALYDNGSASIQGALYFNPTFVSATGTYNMTATDAFVIFTGSTATVVYPTAFNGRAFYLVNQASGTVTIPTTTSANGTTVTTLTAGNKDFIMYDGTNSVWRIIGN
jgi:hypothetical protein